MSNNKQNQATLFCYIKMLYKNKEKLPIINFVYLQLL